MEDFNSYAKKTEGGGESKKSGEGLFQTVSRIVKEFDGKSQNDLLRAIFKEAERSKRQGTLTNAEIDGFFALLSPIIDGRKRGYLKKITEDLKKI